MKRLLLSLLAALALPTAVNAFPWNSDIVVKTDLGEKYIIKESAVTVSPYSWEKRINYLDNFIKDREAKYIKCLKDLSEKDCTDIYKFRQEEFKAVLKKAKDWRDKPKSVVEITFRHIFEDLNNKKIPGDYETIYCLNPKNDGEKILNAAGFKSSSVPDRQSKLAFEITKSKVCDKYAKF